MQVDERVGHRLTACSCRRTRNGTCRSGPSDVSTSAEEPVGVAHQVVGLPLGHRAPRAGLGSGPLAGTGGEERRPLGELGGHLGEQHPGVLLPACAGAAPGWARAASSAAVARSAATWAWA